MLGPEHPRSGAVWGNERRGAAQCEPCALGWTQELVASPFCSAGTILTGAGHLSLPAPAAFAASLILRKSDWSILPRISQISLDPSGFAAWLGSDWAHLLWWTCGFTGLFTQGVQSRVPFRILDVHMFPMTGAGLCCPSAIFSSWDAWHRGPFSVGGFEGGGVCFRLSCFLSDT